MFTSYTATTFIEADPERVFEYVRVPENQPSWAINFVRSTHPLSGGRYAMQTPAGELIYRIEEDRRCRTVDFVYETPEGEKTMILPTRVVPHGRGSVFTFTIHRQPGMGDIEWEGGQRGLDEELAELKKLLETPEAATAFTENQGEGPGYRTGHFGKYENSCCATSPNSGQRQCCLLQPGWYALVRNGQSDTATSSKTHG